eukprot:scaffold4406_cov34-Prasinocladus_malaysianus.AAC.1
MAGGAKITAGCKLPQSKRWLLRLHRIDTQAKPLGASGQLKGLEAFLASSPITWHSRHLLRCTRGVRDESSKVVGAVLDGSAAQLAAGANRWVPGGPHTQPDAGGLHAYHAFHPGVSPGEATRLPPWTH